MRYGGLNHKQRRAFRAALKARVRTINVRLRVYNKMGEPMGKKLTLLDGEVVMDTTDPKSPCRTAHLTIVDPKRKHGPFVKQTRKGLWFDKQIGIFWGIWVPDMPVGGQPVGKWVYIPIFRGWIHTLTRAGAELEIDCVGKDAQHLEPHVLVRPFSVRKHHRIRKAIVRLLRERGESGIEIGKVHGRFREDKTYGIGRQPMLILRGWVNSLGRIKKRDNKDHHIYIRGNGRWRVRREPRKPVWTFKHGEDSLIMGEATSSASIEEVLNFFIVESSKTVKVPQRSTTELDAKATNADTSVVVKSAKNISQGATIEIGRGNKLEEREVTSVSGTTIHFTKKSLNKGPHAKGTVVKVHHTDDKQKKVVERARLPRTSPISAGYLTDGKRPRVKRVDVPEFKKKKKNQKLGKRLDRRANQMARKHRTIPTDRGVLTAVIPMLEELDVVRVKLFHHTIDLPTKSMVIPLVGGQSDLNWHSELYPKKKRKRKKKKLKVGGSFKIPRPGGKDGKYH